MVNSVKSTIYCSGLFIAGSCLIGLMGAGLLIYSGMFIAKHPEDFF